MQSANPAIKGNVHNGIDFLYIYLTLWSDIQCSEHCLDLICFEINISYIAIIWRNQGMLISFALLICTAAALTSIDVLLNKRLARVQRVIFTSI